MGAETALRIILWRLLQDMQESSAGIDPDGSAANLHDFRVSVRRTRTVLKQVKNVLPPADVAWFLNEFAWLSSISSAARDLDVHLGCFPDFLQRLTPSEHESLADLCRFLECSRVAQYRILEENFNSERFRDLMARWRTFLEKADGENAAPNGSRSVVAVASNCIWASYRRVLREGRAIHRNSPPQDLHNLRKSCKKLRYLLEFFKSLYPPDEIETLIKVLKKLQNNLGAYQDIHVQMEALRRFSSEMARESQVSVETLLAVGRLLEKLDREQNKEREAFARRFKKFSHSKIHKHFQVLFSCRKVESA